jgi:hypothetical protein
MQALRSAASRSWIGHLAMPGLTAAGRPNDGDTIMVRDDKGLCCSAVDSQTPVRQHILQCLLPQYDRPPLQQFPCPCRIATSHANIGLTDPAAVDADLYRDPCKRREIGQHIANTAWLPGCQVDDHTARQSIAPGDARHIGGANITDIKKVPPRVEIANLQNRRLQTSRDARDLSRKSGYREIGRLPRTSMVERARVNSSGLRA